MSKAVFKPGVLKKETNNILLLFSLLIFNKDNTV